MRHEPTSTIECEICKRLAELRLRAQPIGRVTGKAFLRSTGDKRSPGDSVAIAWNTGADAFLRKEMAAHPSCDQCGILMGPGHIEPAGTEICGTCRTRLASRLASANSTPVLRTSFGRRGWHSDYLARQ